MGKGIRHKRVRHKTGRGIKGEVSRDNILFNGPEGLRTRSLPMSQ